MHSVKMWSSIAVFVALVAALGHAQIPQHCASPPQLTFKSTSFNHRLSEFRSYVGQYDLHNQRTAYKGDSKSGRHERFEWFIVLHKEKTVYEINMKNETCRKFPFDGFNHLAVPKQAKFEGAYEIGGPGESVEVDEWFAPHLFGGKAWVGVFSRKHCYPVSTFLLRDHHNETITTTFHNVVEGIINPDWFIPPKSCN